MAGENETLEKSRRSLVGVRNEKDETLLGSNLHVDAELNDSVSFDASIEKDKYVNPRGVGAAGAPCEGSQVVRSLESKSENEKSELELDENDATLKKLDEQKNVDHGEVNEVLEKEATSDLIQVESDVRLNVEGKAGSPQQIGSHGEQGIQDEEVSDAKRRKRKDGKGVKHATLKNYQVSYELPTEKDGKFSVNDIVWGKVRSHPWWPGQIFDPSDSSPQAMKHFRRDRNLVAYFGDKTFAWNEASQLKPFRKHFSYLAKQSNSEAFQNAVDCALDEVTRRVEFGLACSCIPKDTYDTIKHQIVENPGVRQELSFGHKVDESLNVRSFSPEKLMEYLKNLSKLPTGGFDRLELLIAKAQLLAFYRSKGYSHLPELQYCGGLDNDFDTITSVPNKNISEVDELATHSKNDDQAGTGNSKTKEASCRKRKHNLKGDMYTGKTKSNLSKPTGWTPDSTRDDCQSDDEVIANLISSASSKKRRTVDHHADVSGKKAGRKTISPSKVSSASSKKRRTVDHHADVSGNKARRKTISPAKVSSNTKRSFIIGECILRVASQLTGSPTLLKCSRDKSWMADGIAGDFSGSGSDVISPNIEETQNSSLIVPNEYSSLSDLLSSLHWVAQKPLGEYSFLNVLVSFFSDFRNSVIVDSDYGKEMLSTNRIGAKGKERPAGKSPEVSHARRSYSDKQFSDNNPDEVPEEPSGHIDENSPAEIVLNFAEVDSIPSETSLNKSFSHFGPLKEFETEVDRGSSQARVVFKKSADAEVAFNSVKKSNILGPLIVNYQLNYSPSTLFKVASSATTQDPEMHLNICNSEVNMV